MGAEQTSLSQWLSETLAAAGAVAGTVHLRDGEVLRLQASVNIPDPVLRVTAEIPKGKGMAGLAFEREQPVQTCNLKTDDSGDVRPGARAVSAQAAIAIPVMDATGAVRAVVGFAFADERELSEAEVARYTQAARALP